MSSPRIDVNQLVNMSRTGHTYTHTRTHTYVRVELTSMACPYMELAHSLALIT